MAEGFLDGFGRGPAAASFLVDFAAVPGAADIDAEPLGALAAFVRGFPAAAIFLLGVAFPTRGLAAGAFCGLLLMFPTTLTSSSASSDAPWPAAAAAASLASLAASATSSGSSMMPVSGTSSMMTVVSSSWDPIGVQPVEA